MYMFSRRRNLFPEEEILFLIDNKHIVSFIWQVMKFPFESVSVLTLHSDDSG